MLRRILIVITVIALIAVSSGVGVLVALWPELRG
jgi:hypothetical protein